MTDLLPRPPRKQHECKLCKRIRWFIVASVLVIIVAKTNPDGLRALSFVTTENVALLITGLLGATIISKVLHWHFIGRYEHQEQERLEQEEWDKKQKIREKRMAQKLAKQQPSQTAPNDEHLKQSNKG